MRGKHARRRTTRQAIAQEAQRAELSAHAAAAEARLAGLRAERAQLQEVAERVHRLAGRLEDDTRDRVVAMRVETAEATALARSHEQRIRQLRHMVDRAVYDSVLARSPDGEISMRSAGNGLGRYVCTKDFLDALLEFEGRPGSRVQREQFWERFGGTPKERQPDPHGRDLCYEDAVETSRVEAGGSS